MRYLYDGHIGSIFTTDTRLSTEQCHCETCGDFDWLLGDYETVEQFWNLIKDECDIDNSGGWALQYILPMIVSEFDLPIELTYDDYQSELDGYCSLSNEQILELIEKYKDASIEDN